MDWGNLSKRDYQFEALYGFSPEIDYEKEVEIYKDISSRKCLEDYQSFATRHKGIIAFWAKVYYYKELKGKGLI